MGVFHYALLQMSCINMCNSPYPEQITFDSAWPLAYLDPESFEKFSTEFLQFFYDSATVNQYGDRGHKQHGLDIEISFPDGKEYTAQCKREKNFGPAQVKAAVAKHTKHADKKILLLAYTASPDARDEIKNHPDWELWDCEDISRHIRQYLSKADQTCLADTYFPQHRYALTGELEASIWRTPVKFFKPYTNNTCGFSQDWELVGRDRELEKLVSFCHDDDLVLFLTANAGVGKTRLLKALADNLQSNTYLRRVYFSSSESLSSKSLEGLGTSPKLLICDDAHEREDLRLLFEYALNPLNNAKVIISFRRYALSHIMHQAVGYKLSEIKEVQISLLKKN